MYEKCIDMFLLTGKIPANLIDAICADAHRQINSALKLSEVFDNRTHNEKVYEDINARREEFKSDWFDYENYCFSMGGGVC